MTEQELLEYANRLKIMAQAISRKEKELLMREKKLQDNEATLRTSYLEVKSMRDATKQ
jgi:hypothetical protein